MSNSTLTRRPTSTLNYSPHDLDALTDQSSYRRNQLSEHYRECGTCYQLAQVGRRQYDSVGCYQAQELAERVIDLDLELGHWPAVHRYGLSWFYENEHGFHAWEPVQEVMSYVETSHEREYDRWAIEPDVTDDWTAEQVLRAAREPESPAQGADRLAARAQHLVSSAVWNAETPWELYCLTDGAALDTQALLQAHARIWQTPRGEVGIYKTFISQVTDQYFTAYCSVCKRRMVLERTLRNVVATILHAHTHVPDSVLQGSVGASDTQQDDSHDPYVTLTGSEATPLPGESVAADRKFVEQAGRWYIDSAFVDRRENGTPIDAVTQEWIWSTYSGNLQLAA